MERKDNSASWCWTVQRRCLPFNSELFNDGDQFCHMGWKHLPLDGDPLELDTSETKVLCSIAGCSAILSSLKKYEAHYNITHQHVCSICHKIMPSAHLLEIHILETHDSMFGLLAATKNMYQCLLESCSETFSTPSKRHEHMKKVHKYPANFRFDRRKQDRNKSHTSSNSHFPTSSPMAKTEHFPDEASSLMDVCTVKDASGKNEVVSTVGQVLRCLSTENDLDVGTKGHDTPHSKLNSNTFKKQRKKSPVLLPTDVGEMNNDLRNLKQGRTGQETFSSTVADSSNSFGNSIEDCNMDKISKKAPSRKFTYKVPKNVCFGHGSTKSFQRSRNSFSQKMEKHWHSTACDDSTTVNVDMSDDSTTVNIENVDMSDDSTTVNIENVDMSDLSSALIDQ